MSDVGCAVGADGDQGQVNGEAEGNVTIGFLGTVERLERGGYGREKGTEYGTHRRRGRIWQT